MKASARKGEILPIQWFYGLGYGTVLEEVGRVRGPGLWIRAIRFPWGGMCEVGGSESVGTVCGWVGGLGTR